MDIYNNLIPELQSIVEFWFLKIDLHSRLHKAQGHLEKNFIRHRMSHRNNYYSIFYINDTMMVIFQLDIYPNPIYGVVTILVEDNLFEIRANFETSFFTHCTKKIVDKTKTFILRKNGFPHRIMEVRFTNPFSYNWIDDV